MRNLTPNTEYEVYVTALTDKGESPPAETLTVWTEAAYPAYVEVSESGRKIVDYRK